MTTLLQEAQALFPYTQAMRRDFHKHPELGFHEIRTSGIVAKELEALGLEVTRGIGKTGVVAIIEGANPGPTVLLRFDMDALPMSEDTGAPYASTVEGVMHACGHDGHTAVGLTVAKLLQNHRSEMKGNIKLCFQPSEEGFNGEDVSGAEMMIRDGVLENPRVDKTLALHVWNDKPVGWVSAAAGPTMAGAEQFTIDITGKGGHGASPHLSVDPIVAAAHVITALQTIVARNVEPIQTAVVTVTTMHSGTAFNIIPQTATLTGTIRTFDPGVRETVLKRMNEIVTQVCGALGCEVKLDIQRVTPAVINDAAIAERVQAMVKATLPNVQLETAGYTTMGAEDMAFMQELVPGCYFFVGSQNKSKNLDYGHHHPKFDIDEQSLTNGAAIMAAAALDLLR